MLKGREEFAEHVSFRQRSDALVTRMKLNPGVRISTVERGLTGVDGSRLSICGDGIVV